MKLSSTILIAGVCLSGLAGCASEEEARAWAEAEAPDELGVVQGALLSLNRVTAIRNLYTGKCMDIANGSAASGVPVNQYHCHGGPAQQFRLQTAVQGTPLLRVVNVNSGLCVVPTGYRGWSTQSMRLVQAPCGTAYASWTLDRRTDTPTGATAALRWGYDGAYCIDVPGGWSVDSLQLQAYPCHGGPNQTFDLRQ